MEEHPNVALLRRGYEAFAKEDMATLTELIDENVIYHSSGRNPLAGEYKGRNAVFDWFGQIAERSGGTFRVVVDDILANAERGVVLTRAAASREGKQLDSMGSATYRIRNGKVVEAWFYSEDPYDFDEFWS
jgi:ketosteroid isomerase-like protein